MIKPDPEDCKKYDFPLIGSVGGGSHARVRFYNLTIHSVDLIWMRRPDVPVIYGTLRPQQYLDISTFEGHPWIVRRTVDGEEMYINQKTVFWPVAEIRHVVVRSFQLISSPMKSLFELCAQKVAMPGTPLTQEDLDNLPKDILELLKSYRAKGIAYTETMAKPPPLR